ncbi:unnamed protein product [Cylicocyclus nassatus]|uniref:Uncharacterized protein n=1 Tax=Cylicocyclus nassatus TaxID=53992 RepID=A0AA36MB71_CYLNA|nr:unnamed protein product [Cylicocyclus nassatus]
MLGVLLRQKESGRAVSSSLRVQSFSRATNDYSSRMHMFGPFAHIRTNAILVDQSGWTIDLIDCANHFHSGIASILSTDVSKLPENVLVPEMFSVLNVPAANMWKHKGAHSPFLPVLYPPWNTLLLRAHQLIARDSLGKEKNETQVFRACKACSQREVERYGCHEGSNPPSISRARLSDLEYELEQAQKLLEEARKQQRKEREHIEKLQSEERRWKHAVGLE